MTEIECYDRLLISIPVELERTLTLHAANAGLALSEMLHEVLRLLLEHESCMRAAAEAEGRTNNDQTDPTGKGEHRDLPE